MNKVSIILISIVYIASIVIISLLGMNAFVFDPNIPVTGVLCTNQTDNRVEVSIEAGGVKLIKIPYTTPGDAATGEGTMVQLEWRVLPDNASTKDIRFVFDKPENEEENRISSVLDGGGNEIGLFVFSGKHKFDVEIQATDGSRIGAKVIIWAY